MPIVLLLILWFVRSIIGCTEQVITLFPLRTTRVSPKIASRLDLIPDSLINSRHPFGVQGVKQL